ncbi:MAG: DNA repair exonuclease [Desulfobacteraceae bacterium]
MASFSFIHAADIHLDSPLLNLEKYEGAPVNLLRSAARKSLKDMVTLAIDRKVDFVLFSGDLYDGDWRDYNTGLFFISQMARLSSENIKVFIVLGNHDAKSRITRSLRLPSNVCVFSTERPETVTIEPLEVAIHGRSFPAPSVTENLSLTYPDPVPGYFNIGMLHTSLTGREGHETYAPCSVDDLKSKEYDYWALGHVHTLEIISSSPLIVFSGNIQGRHAKEDGEKGCMRITVSNDGGIDREFKPLDRIRWHRLAVNARGLETELDIVDAVLEKIQSICDDRFAAVRISVTGVSPELAGLKALKEKWVNEIRAGAVEIGHGSIWIEKVSFEYEEKKAALSELPAVSEINSVFREAREDDVFSNTLFRELDPLLKKMPLEFSERMNPASGVKKEWFGEILDRAEDILMHRIAGHPDGERDS